MLTDPYGALVKNFCLIAFAITIWILAPIAESCGRVVAWEQLRS
jgi:hypothetical protein